MSSEHGMTPCIGSGSCEISSDGVFNSTSLAILNVTMRSCFDFLLLPLDILVTRECEIEKNSSPLKQGATFSSMEHQKFDKNLKSAKVFNSCHIQGLFFYAFEKQGDWFSLMFPALSSMAKTSKHIYFQNACIPSPDKPVSLFFISPSFEQVFPSFKARRKTFRNGFIPKPSTAETGHNFLREKSRIRIRKRSDSLQALQFKN